MKDIVIIGLLALIMCFKLFDISSDIQLGIPQWHLVHRRRCHLSKLRFNAPLA